MKDKIRVKDIMAMLTNRNPLATVDFYHYSETFSEANAEQLRCLWTDWHVDLYVTDPKEGIEV